MNPEAETAISIFSLLIFSQNFSVSLTRQDGKLSLKVVSDLIFFELRFSTTADLFEILSLIHQKTTQIC